MAAVNLKLEWKLVACLPADEVMFKSFSASTPIGRIDVFGTAKHGWRIKIGEFTQPLLAEAEEDVHDEAEQILAALCQETLEALGVA